MQATGIVRRIDELGRIVIPKEIRRTMRLEDGVPVEFVVTEEGLLLRRHTSNRELNEMVTGLEQEITKISAQLGKEKTQKIKGHMKSIRQLVGDRAE